MKQPRKVSLINVHDYRAHRAWYEIMVLGDDVEGYLWRVRVYSRGGASELLQELVGAAESRDQADTQAQTTVKTEMEKYRP